MMDSDLKTLMFHIQIYTHIEEVFILASDINLILIYYKQTNWAQT